VDELLKLDGQTLGHFRIDKLLGRGQSGVVFRSVDVRNNHPVALKVLSPDFPKTEAELQRFARALKVVPQLHHAHLITVFGAGKLADLMLNQALEGSGLQKAILGRKMLAELPYLAPEQSDPHDPVTPAGDIYALGGVLYGLLTGQPPFQAETPREVRALAREG